METIWNYTHTHVWQILLIIYAIALFVVDFSYRRLKRKYAHQGCDLIDAQLNWKNCLKGMNELIEKSVAQKEEIIALNSGIGVLERNEQRLHKRLQDTNIQLINAKGQVLFLKQRKKEIKRSAPTFTEPVTARMVYNKCKGWRVKIYDFVGYVAGWNIISGEVIIGFYEYTGMNNIAITDDCNMSRREYVDYCSLSIISLTHAEWL